MDFIKRLIILVLAAVLLCNCSEEKNTAGTDITNATITLSTDVLPIGREGGEVSVTVNSSADWKLAGMYDWVRPSATEGKNGDVITFTVDKDELNETRIATFKFFTGSSVASLRIESNTLILDLTSDEQMYLPTEKNIMQIHLDTNINNLDIAYSDGGEEWLHFIRQVEVGGGKTILSFNVDENALYKNRSSRITVNVPQAEKNIEVNVEQKQRDVILLDQEMLMYDMTARTVSFEIKTNVDIVPSIVKGEEWITEPVSATSPRGEDGLFVVSFTCQLSETPELRGGTIRIAQLDNEELNREITVVQKDPNTELATIPDATLRKTCEKNKWIVVIAGDQCSVLETGLTATNLRISGAVNFTGIGSFPNLTSLRIDYGDGIKKLNLSELHNLTTLQMEGVVNCEEYNLGDNPIKKFTIGDQYAYLSIPSLKIISEKVETVDLTLWHSYVRYDKVTSIDVSECPALTTLKADRGDKVTTIYLKNGQNIPNLTKNKATQIVYK